MKDEIKGVQISTYAEVQEGDPLVIVTTEEIGNAGQDKIKDASPRSLFLYEEKLMITGSYSSVHESYEPKEEDYPEEEQWKALRDLTKPKKAPEVVRVDFAVIMKRSDVAAIDYGYISGKNKYRVSIIDQRGDSVALYVRERFDAIRLLDLVDEWDDGLIVKRRERLLECHE